MSIKDLFGKRSNKVVSKAQAEKLLDEVESSAQIEATRIRNNKLVTRIDYSTPDKFARYGSAEKYYEDSFSHIYNTYPYDGSAAEKEVKCLSNFERCGMLLFESLVFAGC